MKHITDYKPVAVFEDGHHKKLELRFVPDNVYHGDLDYLSIHRLRDMSVCAFKAVKGEQVANADALRLGSATHCYVLRRNDFEKEFAVAPELNLRTKEGKAQFEEFQKDCITLGKEIVKASDFPAIQAMAKAIDGNGGARAVLALDTDGERVMRFREVVGTWVETIDGKQYPCKAKFDALTIRSGTVVIGDLKTTSNASVKAFSRSVIDFGYAWQANFYSRAFKPFFESVNFGVVAIEKTAPYAQLVCFLDDYADACENRVSRAIQEYEDLKANAEKSFGYSLGEESVQLPIPRWWNPDEE